MFSASAYLISSTNIAPRMLAFAGISSRNCSAHVPRCISRPISFRFASANPGKQQRGSRGWSTSGIRMCGTSAERERVIGPRYSLGLCVGPLGRERIDHKVAEGPTVIPVASCTERCSLLVSSSERTSRGARKAEMLSVTSSIMLSPEKFASGSAWVSL